VHLLHDLSFEYFGFNQCVVLLQVQWHDGSFTLYDGEEDLYAYKGSMWRVTCVVVDMWRVTCVVVDM
jgi:hypothetical protein